MDLYLEISVLFGGAALLSLLAQRFKLPMMLAFLVTGLIFGPLGFHLVHAQSGLETFAELGVAALLFIIGLNLSPRVLKELGMSAVVLGLGQCVATALPAYGLARLVGFSSIASVYTAIVCTLSSTIIVSKILSDRKRLDSLPGKLSIGLLLVQDVIAALALLFVGSAGHAERDALVLIGILGGMVLTLLVLSRFILPKLVDAISTSSEALFLFALGWGIGLSGVFHAFGFPLEIGALVAGISLSMTPYHFEMAAKVKVVRDFFLVVFFVLLGTHISPTAMPSWWMVGVFSGYFIVIKPLILAVIVGLMGHNARTSLETALTIGQMSEFSFILLSLGVARGHIDESFVTLLSLAGILSITISSLLMTYTDQVLTWLLPLVRALPWRSGRVSHGASETIEAESVLIGCHRLGADFLPTVAAWKRSYVVVDVDPEVVRALQAKRVPAIYADALDAELWERLDMRQVKLVVCTLPDLHQNMSILEHVRRRNARAVFIGVASTVEEGMRLYSAGAAYVVMPHFLGGNHASMLLDKYGARPWRFGVEGKRHREHLRKRTKLQEAPALELKKRWGTLH